MTMTMCSPTPKCSRNALFKALLTQLRLMSGLSLTVLFSATALSETLPIRENGDIVGRLRLVHAQHKDSLPEIGRATDLGYNQIVKANPHLNRWLPGHNAQVLIPSEYILPNTPRDGIVINVAELRLYYYPKNASEVVTFPISIGRMDWKTPLGVTKIVRKDENPRWYPPESIRAEHARDGDPLPEFFPGGHPENPLGKFALRLAIPTYLIHGTDQRKALGIGMRVTHGCIRMYPEDIARLFGLVAKNTSVNIINEPVKIGWENNRLFLQITTPLHEDSDYYELDGQEVLRLVERLAGPDAYVDPSKVFKAAAAGDGILVEVGRRVSTPNFYSPPFRPRELPTPQFPEDPSRDYQEDSYTQMRSQRQIPPPFPESSTSQDIRY